jgi:hypothetical protein
MGDPVVIQNALIQVDVVIQFVLLGMTLLLLVGKQLRSSNHSSYDKMEAGDSCRT